MTAGQFSGRNSARCDVAYTDEAARKSQEKRLITRTTSVKQKNSDTPLVKVLQSALEVEVVVSLLGTKFGQPVSHLPRDYSPCRSQPD